jgi:hypothetical protein
MYRVLPVKPQFFLNKHHRKVFQQLFPHLAKEIDLPPERAFSPASQRAWMAEFDRMMDAGMVEQARMVLVYYAACEAKQENKLKAA